MMTGMKARTFTSELTTMTTVLQHAMRMVESLQELHQEDIAQAVEDLLAKRWEVYAAPHAADISPADAPHAPEISHADADSGDRSSMAHARVHARKEHPVLSMTSFTGSAPSDSSVLQSWNVENSTQMHSSRKTTTGGSEMKVAVGDIRDMWDNYQKVSPASLRFEVDVVHSSYGKTPRRLNPYSEYLRKTKSDEKGWICRLWKRWWWDVIHPLSNFRLVWDMVSFFFILYDLIIVPLYVFEIEHVVVLQVFEWIIGIWWTLDVWISFRTGYVTGSHIELRPKTIAIHYVRTWLIVDLAIVVLEWVSRVMKGNASASILRGARVHRTLKVCKILRFMRILRAERMRLIWNMLQDKVQTRGFSILFTVLGLVFTLLLSMHITACIWYAIGDHDEDGWITYGEYQGRKDTFFWYISSFRWVISQINGRTDMNDRRTMIERLFTCTVGIGLGICYQAVFIGMITNTMLELSAAFSDHARRQRAVREYLEEHPLSPTLSSKVKFSHHQYQDNNSELEKEQRVLAILSKDVKTNVLYEVRSAVLKEHQFFSTFCLESIGVMRLVCQDAAHRIPVCQDEVIFDQGDVCERMLFLQLTAIYGDPTHTEFALEKSDLIIETNDLPRTSLFHRVSTQGSVQSDNGEEVCVTSLPTNSWISEAALWIEWRNRGRMLSTSHGTLIEVQAHKLVQALKKDPDAFALACFYAQSLADELREHQDLSDILPFTVHLRRKCPEDKYDAFSTEAAYRAYD